MLKYWSRNYCKLKMLMKLNRFLMLEGNYFRDLMIKVQCLNRESYKDSMKTWHKEVNP